MFVINKKQHFIRLVSKRIGLELGCGFRGHFEGVGIVVVSAPAYPDHLITLYPSFYAPNDPICTISTGALRRCAGFSRVVVDTGDSLHLHHCSGLHMRLPLHTAGDIDYVTLNIHQPTRETAMRL